MDDMSNFVPLKKDDLNNLVSKLLDIINIETKNNSLSSVENLNLVSYCLIICLSNLLLDYCEEYEIDLIMEKHINVIRDIIEQRKYERETN